MARLRQNKGPQVQQPGVLSCIRAAPALMEENNPCRPQNYVRSSGPRPVGTAATTQVT
jgi:hypothetical protein